MASKVAPKLGLYAAYQVERFRDPGTFAFRGETHRCFVHPYNGTWRNERAAEIPLARHFLGQVSGRGLEVGNVLSHYGPIHHTVVDRYERDYPDAVNVDILDYAIDTPLDYVISISTIEHVGWDEAGPGDPDKARRAIAHLRSLLSPSGTMFVTCPAGHNPGVDALMFDPAPSPPVWDGFLERVGPGCRFRELDHAEARERTGATAPALVVWLAVFGPAGPDVSTPAR